MRFRKPPGPIPGSVTGERRVSGAKEASVGDFAHTLHTVDEYWSEVENKRHPMTIDYDVVIIYNGGSKRKSVVVPR